MTLNWLMASFTLLKQNVGLIARPNDWVFAYKDNNDFITNNHVCAKITNADSRMSCVYDDVFVCSGDKIVSLRPATREDMDAFWSYLDRWDYKYCLNTKKLRYVGCE